MAYSGVYVFGDSLVDAGNALKLAETYDYFPFTSLPNGAPTPERGYHAGRFTDGWTYTDLISNKLIGNVTKPVFPFGYDEPYLGISFGFFSDPDGNNLNFAYGGAQLRQGDEAVPDIDDQTDAFRDAVDGDADPNALYIFSFGANDVHDLVPNEEAWASPATAQAVLADAAEELIEEILQIIDIGARHIVVTGVPDIGIQPIFNGTPNEADRRAVATEYSNLLDQMIRDGLAALDLPDGVEIHYVSFDAMQDAVIGTMTGLYGADAIYPLQDSSLVFMDLVHPSAQVHALGAAFILDQINDTAAGEALRLTAPDYSSTGVIGTRGEIDTITVSLAANTEYRFDALGLSTLGGNVTTLADPMLRVFRPDGTLAGSNDDGGLGLDSSFTFFTTTAGDYTIQLSGVGRMTGNYQFEALGQATGDNVYSVSHANAIVLERAGGGFDTVKASLSYLLNAGAEIEVLRTSNDKGKASINLTGNEYGQSIIGNAGSNILEGKAGADVMTGGAGKDVFVLSNAAVIDPGAHNIDRITDYGSGEVVDVSQVLSVAAGVNVVAGGYVRVTTGGLIQVDVDGGGNNWVTLSQINNGGSVTVRYLSGGVATSLSVARVAATTSTAALAGAVAAAGLAALPAAAETTGFTTDSAASLQMLAPGNQPIVSPLTESLPWIRMIEQTQADNFADLAVRHQESWQSEGLAAADAPVAGEMAVRAETYGAPSDYSHGGTTNPGILAQSVGMPSAAELLSASTGLPNAELQGEPSLVELLTASATQQIDELLDLIAPRDEQATQLDLRAGFADHELLAEFHAPQILFAVDAAEIQPDLVMPV